MLRWVLGLCVWAQMATGQMYPDALLRDTAQRMGPNLHAMLQDIIVTVPRAERPRAAHIALVLPLRGRHPLDVYAYPGRGEIHLPIQTLRFFDDLAILQSWFVSNNCNAAPLQTYLWALLREGRDMPAPLDAFGLDRDRLLADRFTDDVSAKILKSGLYYLLSHEIAHIVLRHKGGAVGPFSQRQEHEADAYAMDRFADIGSNPGGAALYFLAARWLDPVGTAVRTHSHPVAPDRIRHIAQRLAEDPQAFSFSEPIGWLARRQVRQMADDFRSLADLSSDEAMLTLLPHGLNEDFPLSRLHSACPA